MEKQELRNLLLDAFKELRKEEKFIARANFMCCQSCASYDIWESARKNYFKSRKRGYVYWHRQDEDDFWRSGTMFLAYGSFNEEKDEVEDDEVQMKSPLSCKDVGVKILLALAKRGVRVEWNGEDSQRIRVAV